MAHFFPEQIFAEAGTPSGPEYRTWNRLELANADATIDTNGIVNSFSEDGTGATIEVAAGTTTDFPADAATYFFELNDELGNPLTGTQYWDAKLYLRIDTPPSVDAKVWVGVGFYNSTAATAGLYGGLVWNSATGQKVRAGNTAANTDSAANANIVHCVVEGTVLSSALRYLSCAAIDSSKLPEGTVAARGGNVNLNSPPNYIGVTVGRTATSGSAETVKINAYVLSIMPSEVLP